MKTRLISEQDHRQHRAVRQVEVPEDGVVGVERQHLGGAARAAAGQRQDQVEGVQREDEIRMVLIRRIGRSCGRVMYQNCLQRGGAVDRGRLVEAARDDEQAGVEQDHAEGGAAPDVGDHRRPDGDVAGRRARRPARRPIIAQQRVQEAVARLVEHQLPDDAAGDARHDPGAEDDDADEATRPAARAARRDAAPARRGGRATSCRTTLDDDEEEGDPEDARQVGVAA